MKKNLFLILCLLSFTIHLFANRCNMTVTIQNKTSKVLNLYSWKSSHGSETAGFLTHVFQPGDVSYCRFDSKIMTGVEGVLQYTAGGTIPAITIYYDNPLIGGACYAVTTSGELSCTLVSWVKMNWLDDYALNIQINEAGSGATPVDIAYDTRGVIKGALYWKKDQIKGPEIFPPYKAFELNAFAPVQFTTSSGAGIKGTYNGSQGTFTGAKKVGSILYTIDNSDATYYRINYVVSDLPVNVPVQFDITTGTDITRWFPGELKLNKPDSSSVFVVGTFPVMNSSTITMRDNMLEATGVDFICEGDWMQVSNTSELTGSAEMVNKISIRKTAAVLPYESLNAGLAAKTNSNQVMQVPGVQNKTQQVQVQKVRTAGAVKIRQ